MTRLKIVGMVGVVLSVGTLTLAQRSPAPPILMDGHVHITNRVYWEGIDPWKPSQIGLFDYARAWEGGANIVVENLGTYGYEDYDGTVKQAGRLIETFHRTLEAHRDRMELALTSADARRIVASGKMAVFLGIESGWDQDGDIDILRLWYRLGVRSVVFTSHQTNAYADSVMRGGEHWGGINQRGRELVAEANRLGMLLDLSHATDAARRQIVEASRTPVVASHVGLKSVSDRPLNIADDVAQAIGAKGGLIGVTSVASMTTRRYWDWSNTHRSPETGGGITPGTDWTMTRKRAPDYGEYAGAFDPYMRERWRIMWSKPWQDDPEAPVPTVDEWADHVKRVVDLIGADHVGIGLDLWQGRSHLKDWDARGYRKLAEALKARKIPNSVLGENWLRVFDSAKLR